MTTFDAGADAAADDAGAPAPEGIQPTALDSNLGCAQAPAACGALLPVLLVLAAMVGMKKRRRSR